MSISKWLDWPIAVHEDPDSIKRLLQKVTFVEVNHVNQTATTTNGYSVTLVHCSCPDFSNRHRPCKHIYSLASDLGLLQYPKQLKRSKELLADFSDGFARDWMFGVGSFHWSGLDIKWTPTIQDGQKVKEPTQGLMYYFQPGTVFYNNNPDLYKKAYTKNNSPKIALQIFDSSAPTPKYSAHYGANDILTIDFGISYGTVAFDVFVYEECKPTKLGRYYARSDEFVKLLRDGSCDGIQDNEIVPINFIDYLCRFSFSDY